MLAQDYKPPAYLVDSIYLNFVLNEDVTRCALPGLHAGLACGLLAALHAACQCQKRPEAAMAPAGQRLLCRKRRVLQWLAVLRLPCRSVESDKRVLLGVLAVPNCTPHEWPFIAAQC